MDTSQITSQHCPKPSDDIPCHSETLTASLYMSWCQTLTSSLNPCDLLTSSLPPPLPTLFQPRWLPRSSYTHISCVSSSGPVYVPSSLTGVSFSRCPHDIFLTASGVWSNVTLLDSSCLATPPIPLPSPSLSLYSALLFSVTLANYCVFTCS